jgi:radical SAM superfamily enzyme YgiQ (UPF0313 family)
MFADDNVMIHRKYSAELFSKLQGLNKHWIGQCSLAAVGRIENVKLMAESGCKALFIGFESIDDETLAHTGKRQNRPARYKEVLAMLHDHGISTWGSFVFGFDTDDSEVFDRTVEFGIEMQLTMALYAILTPYPGTKLYKRLLAEGRPTTSRKICRVKSCAKAGCAPGNASTRPARSGNAGRCASARAGSRRWVICR